VVAAGARIDLALPARCTVAELLPALVRAVGASGDPAGWALHRLAGPALPAEQTVAAIGLRDGEVLHLLPTGYPAAEVVFDDLIDAVASNVGAAPGCWRPAWSRRVALVAAAASFAGATTAAATMMAGPAGTLVAGLIAVSLLAAGVTLARRGADALGAALAGAGMPGLLAAVLTGPDWAGLTAAPQRLGAGCVAVAGYAVLAALLLTAYRMWFLAAAGTAAAGALAVGASTAGGFPMSALAAATLVLAVLITPAFPALSLRLAALSAPEVPADMAAFRAAEQPTPAAEVVDKTRVAQRTLTALLTAATVAVVSAAAFLLSGPNKFGWLLSALGGLVMLVRSRAYPYAGQRGALLAGGAVLLAAAAVVAAHAGGLIPLLVGAAALLIGVGCAVHAVRAGRRAPSAYWGRLLDIVDFVAVTALVPVAVGVLSLYRSAQGIVG
jgi:type VII secretion integral membrane protein EccD